MQEKLDIDEFKEYLAGMDDSTLRLLDTLFHSKTLAWLKLHALCQQAKPVDGERTPVWARWEHEVSRRHQATFVKELGTLIRAESARRYEATQAAERARRASITPEDAESLSDSELLAASAILSDTLTTDDSRWRLLARLGACCPRGLSGSAWRKFGRIADGPESFRLASAAAIESEARKRGLDALAISSAPPHPDSVSLHESENLRTESKPTRPLSRPNKRSSAGVPTRAR